MTARKPDGAPSSPAALFAAAEDVVWEGDRRRMLRVGPRLLVDAAPVSCAAYARFIADTGRPAPRDWQGGAPPPERVDHPVVHVTLEDARAYARWANKRLPLNDDWTSAMVLLGFATLGGGHVWEWTATRQHGGHMVRGGRYRDHLDVAPSEKHQSWDDRAAADIGFRCVAEG